MKTNRLLMAMTFMGILLFGPSLFAQQEVDPTWYDPWAAPNKVSASVTQPPAAQSKHQPKMVSGLPKGNSAKVRAKRSVSRRTLSQTDLALSCHSPRNWSIGGIPAFSPLNEAAPYCSGVGTPALNPARPMGRVDPPLEV
jgi:hypothetical protein